MTFSFDLSNFSDVISSLVYTNVFLYFFPLFIEERLFIFFSGTLQSAGYIFPFLLCLSFLFFPQLFVKPPQITTLPSCISFLCNVLKIIKRISLFGVSLESLVRTNQHPIEPINTPINI